MINHESNIISKLEKENALYSRLIKKQGDELKAKDMKIAELARKRLELTALCCMICDLNEFEQGSEDFENTSSELIDRALTVLGRSDT